MTIMATANARKWERPDSGIFHAVLADIVDLGLVKTTYQDVEKEQPMVRFIWILDKNGSDGKPLSITKRYNLVLHEKSNLYKDIKMILNQAPPVPYDIEQLIGVVRKLFIVRAENPRDPTNPYANLQGILPGDPGITVMVPPDFVRAKNRPKTQMGPQGPVQTFATPPNITTTSAPGQAFVMPQTTATSAPATLPATQDPDVEF